MIQRSYEQILASSIFYLSCEWTQSACVKALHCLLYISVIRAVAEERMFKACLSLGQHSLVNSAPPLAVRGLWLFCVAAYLCQADLLLGGTNDLHLLGGTNQLQLLIPSDFNESMNIDNPYLSNVGWANRREDLATDREIICLLFNFVRGFLLI